MADNPLYEIIKTIECDTADELLDSLSPRSEHFASRISKYRKVNQFIFRGHADANEYKLIPTALRLNTMTEDRWMMKTKGGWGKVVALQDEGGINSEGFIRTSDRMVATKNWCNKHQQQAELIMLKDFFEFADASGLPLPEDCQEVRQTLETARIDEFLLSKAAFFNEEDKSVWPPNNLRSSIALAQHYGIPTRLLDWSRNSYIAAYFAAVDAVSLINKSNNVRDVEKKLSVWAFNVELYEWSQIVDKSFPDKSRERISTDRIKIITAPTASNPNLYSQKGVFTLYVSDQLMPDDPVDRRPFDKIIEEMKLNNKLLHFKLPIAESPKLLRLLAVEGINGATLFPGYQGAAKATMEQRYWDKWW